MHKTIADKNGGRNVELSPEEEAAVRADWAKNEAEQIAREKKEAEEKALEDKAVSALTANLPEADRIILKKMIERR